MDAPRRQHHAMPAPMQSQQFPPLSHHTQSGGGGGGGQHHPRHPLPLPAGGGGPRGPAPPISGQKRAFHHRSSDGAGFAKLFVGSLPRNISEDEVRNLFGVYGNVVEVVFLKDKKTGLPQGCCFIKYATVMEAERAIRALDNQRTLPGGPAPLQVKFADGERDHSGPVEHKLFVGSLNKQANELEIEEIFAPYGRVENVYVIRDEHKQSRGCAFVTFPERDMAIQAISALNGVYRMQGCHQPIIVRFADPKRPRSGDARSGSTGSNYSPRSHQGSGGPRGSGGPGMGPRSPVYGWRQGGGPGGPGAMGMLPQGGMLPMGPPGSSPSVRSGHIEGPNAMAIRGGGQPSPALSGPIPVSGMTPQLPPQQGFNDRKPGQVMGQQMPLHQQQFMPHSINPYLPPMQGLPMMHTADPRPQQQQVPLVQFTAGQPGTQPYVHGSGSHPQQVVTSIQQQLPTLPPQQQLPNQPTLMMQSGQALQQQVQRQVLPYPAQHEQQIVKDTPQQAYLQHCQITGHQPGTVQSTWSVPAQQQVTTTVGAATATTVTSTAAAVPTCDWTEHTSPEGHKYYYNSSTGESRWEKPEEFSAFEQQQQQSQPQHLHAQTQQLQSQVPAQQYQHQALLGAQHQHQQPILNPQTQQQLQHTPNHQLQHFPQSQLQQGTVQQPVLQQPLMQLQQPSQLQQSLQFNQQPGGGPYQQLQGYPQAQPANGAPQQFATGNQPGSQVPSANGMPEQQRGAQWVPAAQQQGLSNQEWMWKSKPTGS